MIDFNLKVFIAVAKTLSFTRAAEYLNLSQPAVTSQIKKLEGALRTQLFVRHRNRIALTAAGEILLKYAQEISVLHHKALEEIQQAGGRVAGDLHIGAASLLATYWLPGILGRFRHEYPDVNVSMLVGNSKEILKTLQQDLIELAIVSEPVSLPAFEAAPLYRDELTVIVYPGHPWSAKKSIRRSDLYGADFISREVGSGTREVYSDALKSREAKTLKTVLVLGSTEAVKMAVQQKLGFSIVSRLAVRSEVKQGLLKEVPIADVTMARDFYLIYRPERNLSAAALRLREILLDIK